MRYLPLLFLAFLGASSTQPIQWHAKGIVSTTEAQLNHYERDQWINVDPQDEGLHIELPRNGYSEVLMTDRFDYSEKAVMQVNLTQIKGSFSVQAVCYDGDGKVFTSVDLLEYIESPGKYEVPMKIYRTPLKGTKKIGFRFWLAGDRATATVASLSYGITD
jgi:hypothetical protein